VLFVTFVVKFAIFSLVAALPRCASVVNASSRGNPQQPFLFAEHQHSDCLRFASSNRYRGVVG
jgi:hypothetical protein